jgi:hypothetical protein
MQTKPIYYQSAMRRDVNRIACPPKSGFALVIALSLMAFVLVLVLTMTTLIQVETAGSRVTLSQLRSKMNAHLGALIALGELQKYAGPDQRVTARADILDPYDSAQSTPPNKYAFKSVENPYYTLVWDVSGSEANLPGAAPGHNVAKVPAVLVSGNEDAVFHSSAGGNPPIGPTTVIDINAPDVQVMVGETVSGASDQVYALKQKITNPSDSGSGNYAWWVGDEGVKARVNQYNIYEATDSSESYRWRQNHAASLSLLSRQTTSSSNHYNDPRYSSVFNSSQNAEVDFLAKLNSKQQLSAWPASEFAALDQEQFHNITMHSLGVIADTKNGGLKKNLTPALMLDGATRSPLPDNSLIFPRDAVDLPSGNKYKPFINPTWGLLRDYVNMPASYLPGGEVQARLASPNKTEIAPVITRFQISYAPVYVGSSGGPYRIYLCMAPAVSLWNPYNVPMKTPNLCLLYKPYAAGGSTGKLNDGSRFKVGIGVDSTPAVEFELPSLKFYIPSNTLEPGRSTIFSNDTAQLTAFPTDVSSTLSTGFNPLGYYYLDTGIDSPTDSDPIRLYFNISLGAPAKALRSDNNLLYLIAPNSSGSFTIEDQSILVQHSAVTNWSASSGPPFVEYASPSTAATIEAISPADKAFQSPKLLVLNAMKFASQHAGTLIDLNTNYPTRWLADHNPRASFTGAFLHRAPDPSSNELFSGSLHRNSDAASNFYFPEALTRPFSPVGGTWASPTTDQAVIFDLPKTNQRFTAITQLTHANITSSTQYGGGGEGPRGGRSYYPAYPLGNSFASPYLPAGSLTLKEIGERMFYYDVSYYLNDALYDTFFMSGVRPGDAWTNIQPLANSRLAPHGSPTAAQLQDYNQASSALLLQGAFNVNSTSKQAWAAFLGGLRGTDVQLNLASGSQAIDNTTPYTWLDTPFAGAIGVSDMGADKKKSLIGFRDLSDEQIRWLATRMVEQVKARGPFPSISAFVNRYFHDGSLYRKDLPLTVSNALKLSGALQSAIDSQTDLSSSVNEAYWNEGITIDPGNIINTQNPVAGGGLAAAGIPGVISQAHVLSQLDSALAVRSDTFMIRSYGDALTIDGKVESRMYCDMVVQRLPDYLDDTDRAESELAVLNATNSRFGRRFEIVSINFRGLE